MGSDTGSVNDGTPPAGRSSTTSNMTPLPENFEPGPDDVICGRGKKCYNHIGNERFRQRVLTFLNEYSRAKSKLDKSGVLSKVVYEVRQHSPKGGFVKQDANGVWFEVGDFLAREKTSQAFRDALHDRYKSSNLSKKKRRQEEQAKTHQHAYSKMVRSEYDLSSRLERLSNEVIGSRKFIAFADFFGFGKILPGYSRSPLSSVDGIDALDDFNRSNYEMLSRLHGIQSPRQQQQQQRSESMRYQSGRAGLPGSDFRMSQDKPRSMSHFPDPLFGSSMNAANAMPSEYVGERLSPSQSASGNYRSRTPQSLSNSVSSSEPLPGVPSEVNPLHHSLPEIDFFDLSEKDAAGSGMHRSLPDLSLSRHMPPEEDRKPAARNIEPVPFDRINIPERVESQHKRSSLPPSRPPKVPPKGLPKRGYSTGDDQIPSASTRLSKDLIECLDKMTYHSIADDNPFEPIPLTPQQEKANRTKKALSEEVTAELLNNPMDDSERCDEFAEG